MHYRQIAKISRARNLVRPSRPADHGNRFNRFISLSTLVSSVALSLASIALAYVAMSATNGFNAWQIAASEKSGHDAKQQSCIQMAFGALGAVEVDSDEALDRVAKAVSEIDIGCLRAGIDVKKLILGIATKAANARKAPTDPGKKGNDRPSAEAGIATKKTIARLSDRFYLGEPQSRGFDIRGVGPRIVPDQADAVIAQSSDQLVTPSPETPNGASVNWNSPFGPMRIDIAKPVPPESGDSKLFTFNVGSQF